MFTSWDSENLRLSGHLGLYSVAMIRIYDIIGQTGNESRKTENYVIWVQNESKRMQKSAILAYYPYSRDINALPDANTD